MGHIKTIQEQFEEFHAAHPDVYAEIVRLARVVKAAGFKKVGIAIIWERLRWFYKFEHTQKTDHNRFKLCNDYRSRYARLIMEQEPDLAGFFTLRQLETA